MKLEPLKENATVILFNGIPYVLMKVTRNMPDETADVCHYCDLKHLCINDCEVLRFKNLCEPEFVGQSCCFIENWDLFDLEITDYIIKQKPVQ